MPVRRVPADPRSRRPRSGRLRFAMLAVTGLAAVGACSTSPTDPDPSARVEPVARPAIVRGIYVNAQVAGSSAGIQALLDLADASVVNTFVVDVKERGEVSYPSEVPLVATVGAERGYIPDLRALLTAIREHSIYPIARIVAFRDPVLAEGRPDLAIQTTTGGPWLDPENNRPWVDPYNAEVWDYNVDLAREALEAGFAEIQWDYVRFPDVSDSVRATMVYPAQAARTTIEGIQGFLVASRTALASFGAPITADVFGRVVVADGDMIIGQDFDELVAEIDVVLPMVYPALWASGAFGIPDPNADPYATVRNAMDTAVVRLADVPNARATIRPWLQAFTQGSPAYGAAEMLDQRQATEDAGLQEWLFWNPDSVYPLAGLQ